MTNQMILAAGALFILTLLILLFYQSSAEQTSISVETEAVLAGSGIAQSLIAEIQKRSFDERTTTVTTYYPDSLTLIDSLGPDPGEFFAGKRDVGGFFHLVPDIAIIGVGRGDNIFQFIEHCTSIIVNGNCKSITLVYDQSEDRVQ